MGAGHGHGVQVGPSKPSHSDSNFMTTPTGSAPWRSYSPSLCPMVDKVIHQPSTSRPSHTRNKLFQVYIRNSLIWQKSTITAAGHGCRLDCLTCCILAETRFGTKGFRTSLPRVHGMYPCIPCCLGTDAVQTCLWEAGPHPGQYIFHAVNLCCVVPCVPPLPCFVCTSFHLMMPISGHLRKRST